MSALFCVHVCWIVAKMPLHIANGRPQRDDSTAVSVHLGYHLSRKIVATSAEHVVDDPFAGAAVSLLGVRLVHSVQRGGC